MLSVVCWRWGTLFETVYVNRLRAAIDRHLHLDHEMVCVTDDPTGLDGDIRIVPMPTTYATTPRCRRRMQQYSLEFAQELGPRMLSIDLDMVIVDDITPIVNRLDPLVLWRVDHAGVYSGSFVLADAGVLDHVWRQYQRDPDGFPRSVQSRGIPSDQAMINHYLQTQPTIPYWTAADGFVTYYGVGYERFEHLGIGPNRPTLPAGARIVVLGSDDKIALDEGWYPWGREHWGEPIRQAVA